MEWRLPRAQWKRGGAEGNRLAMQMCVRSGVAPGILAYRDGEVVGWCSISPRAGLAGLKDAGTFSDFDDPGVWSLVCFHVAPRLRRRGLMVELLRAALAHAARSGARLVEAYPVDPSVPGAFEQTGFMGTVSTFRRAGFVSAAAGESRLEMTGYTDGTASCVTSSEARRGSGSAPA